MYPTHIHCHFTHRLDSNWMAYGIKRACACHLCADALRSRERILPRAEVIGTYEMSNVGAKEQQVLCAPEYLFFKTSI